jgi:tetratricopeptide (TPR) repeat protein
MKVSATKHGHVHVAKIMLACLALLFLVDRQTTAQVTPEVSGVFVQASEAMRRGDLNAAGDGFSAAAKLAPAFAEAHFNLGLVREEQGRLEEAIASFEKALTLKPRLHGANLFLAVAHYKLNHFDQALAAARKETEAYPKDASAWMWFGVIELAKDRPEEAATALDKAADLNPNEVDILYHRGQAHLLVSNNSYAQMFKVDPKSWRVLQVLAQASSEADRPLDAITEYQDAIKLAPKQPGLHEELGTEYWKAGKLELAEAALQEELEINPNNVLARYKLGTLESARGEGAKSKELIEGALRQNPSLKNSSYYLGRAEMELGSNAEAAKAFDRATIAPDTDPEIVEQAWYQLGIVYRRLHRIEDSQKAFSMFQTLKDEAAQRLQERLKKKRESTAPNSVPPPAPQSPQ